VWNLREMTFQVQGIFAQSSIGLAQLGTIFKVLTASVHPFLPFSPSKSIINFLNRHMTKLVFQFQLRLYGLRCLSKSPWATTSDHIMSTDAILRQNSGGCQTSKDALKEAPWHLRQLVQDTPLSVSIQSPKKQ
jgi:hypothetical protein